MQHDVLQIECAALAGRLSLTKIRRPPQTGDRELDEQLAREAGFATGREMDALGVRRAGRVRDAQFGSKRLTSGRGSRSGNRPLMHIPATRSFRPTTADGRTVFYFDLQPVSREHPPKVELLAKAAGRKAAPKRAGVGAAHGIYVERAGAVALAKRLPVPERIAATEGVAIEIADASGTSYGPYIEREAAVAQQQDGSRVLFTNIDDDPAVRHGFWTAAEAAEREPKPDEMTIRWAGHEQFWSAIRDDPTCPAMLAAGIDTAKAEGKFRFATVANEFVRTWLYERCAPWSSDERPTQEGSEQRKSQPGEWHDGRGGRFQYRIVGEVPAELNLEGMTNVLGGLAAEFDRRKLPYVLVLHEPDYTNSDQNWHLHLIYYDRPSQKLPNGNWDFEQKTVDPSLGVEPLLWGPNKRTRASYPYRQSKVRGASGPAWIKQLREHYADAANEALAAAGERRRLDPRSADVLGIVSTKQDHLGNTLNALKAYGYATEKEVSNECRQAEAIKMHNHRLHSHQLVQIRRGSDELMQKLGLADLSVERHAAAKHAIEAARQQRLSAAELDLAATLMGDAMERTTSRADQALKTTDRYLDAIRKGRAKAADVTRKAELEALRQTAQLFLAEVRPFVVARQAEADAITAEARSLRADAIAAEKVVVGQLEEAARRQKPFGRDPREARARSGRVDESARHAPPLGLHRAIDKLVEQVKASGYEILATDGGLTLDARDIERLGAAEALIVHAVCQRRLVALHNVQRRYRRRVEAWMKTGRASVIVDADGRFELGDRAPDELRHYVQAHKADRGLQEVLITWEKAKARKRLVLAGHIMTDWHRQQEELFGPAHDDWSQPLIERELPKGISDVPIHRDRHGLVVQPSPTNDIAETKAKQAAAMALIKKLDDDGYRIRIDEEGKPQIARWIPSPAEQVLVVDKAHHGDFAAAAARQVVEIEGLAASVYANVAVRQTPDGPGIDITKLGDTDLSSLRWAQEDEVQLLLKEAAQVAAGAALLKQRRVAKAERQAADDRARQPLAMDRWRIVAATLAGLVEALRSAKLVELRSSARDLRIRHERLARAVAQRSAAASSLQPDSTGVNPATLGTHGAIPAPTDRRAPGMPLVPPKEMTAGPPAAVAGAGLPRPRAGPAEILAELGADTPVGLAKVFVDYWRTAIERAPTGTDFTGGYGQQTDVEAARAMMLTGAGNQALRSVIQARSPLAITSPPDQRTLYAQSIVAAATADPTTRRRREEKIAHRAERQDRLDTVAAMARLAGGDAAATRFVNAWEDILADVPLDPDLTPRERNEGVDEAVAKALLDEGVNVAFVRTLLGSYSPVAASLSGCERNDYVSVRLDAIARLSRYRDLISLPDAEAEKASGVSRHRIEANRGPTISPAAFQDRASRGR